MCVWNLSSKGIGSICLPDFRCTLPPRWRRRSPWSGEPAGCLAQHHWPQGRMRGGPRDQRLRSVNHEVPFSWARGPWEPERNRRTGRSWRPRWPPREPGAGCVCSAQGARRTVTLTESGSVSRWCQLSSHIPSIPSTRCDGEWKAEQGLGKEGTCMFTGIALREKREGWACAAGAAFLAPSMLMGHWPEGNEGRWTLTGDRREGWNAGS